MHSDPKLNCSKKKLSKFKYKNVHKVFQLERFQNESTENNKFGYFIYLKKCQMF